MNDSTHCHRPSIAASGLAESTFVGDDIIRNDSELFKDNEQLFRNLVTDKWPTAIKYGHELDRSHYCINDTIFN